MNSLTSRFFGQALAVGILAAGMFVAEVSGEEWPSFRGVNGSGVSTTAKPPTEFGPTNNVAWQVDLPWAPSSPVVSGDQIFVTTFDKGALETRAYSAKEGQLLWSNAVRPERLEDFHQSDGSPAAASPVTDGKHVVSHFGSHGLACYGVDGAKVWERKLQVLDTAGGFGSGTSPILHGNLAIIARDQRRDSALLAVSLDTGKTVWQTPRIDSVVGFGTPTVWTNGTTIEVVVAGSTTLRGHDLKTGAERWIVRGTTTFPCSTPVVGDGLLFFAGWSPGKDDSPWPKWESFAEKHDKNSDNKVTLAELGDETAWMKAVDYDLDEVVTTNDWRIIMEMQAKGENYLLALKPGSAGDAKSKIAWKFTRGLPYVASPLFYQGRIYMVKDGGMVTSLDAATGSVAFQEERINAPGSYYASPVAAAGHIYFASLNGMVTVVKAGGSTPEVLRQIDFGERIAASPALHGKRIYLRTASKLYAFGK